MSGQPSPLISPTVALKVQSCGPAMPAADARSAMVTRVGGVGGGVSGGGFGAGPTPGMAGTAGAGARGRVGSETGPEEAVGLLTAGVRPPPAPHRRVRPA